MDIYKCPFLENGLRELNFSYIITYSASALPILRGIVTFMLLFFIISIIISYHCGVNMVALRGRVGGDSGGII